MITFYGFFCFYFRYWLGLLACTFMISASWAQGGVTVIVHGFTPSSLTNPLTATVGDNFIDFARGIQLKNGKAVIFKNNIKTGRWEKPDKVVNPTKIDASTEIVLVYDWAAFSNNTSKGYLESAADNLFAMLAQPNGITGYSGNLLDNNTLPRHFIGHSRGCIVLLQLLHRIGYYYPTTKIEHLTTLDPHPADNFMNDVGLPAIEKNTGTKFQIRIPENVSKSDNYYRKDGIYELGATFSPLVFDGVSSPNASASRNIELDNDLLTEGCFILGGAHSNVHAWYFGKMNLSAINYGGCSISDSSPECWFKSTKTVKTPSGGTFDTPCPNYGYNINRTQYGYNDSRIGGGYKGLGPVSKPISIKDMGSQKIIQSVFNGSFNEGSFIDGEVAGWSKNGGGGLVYANSKKSQLYTVPVRDNEYLPYSIQHSLMLFGSPAQPFNYLKFKYEASDVSVARDLMVTFRDNANNNPITYRLKIPNNTSTKTVFCPIPNALKQKVGTFQISVSGLCKVSVAEIDLQKCTAKGDNMQIMLPDGLAKDVSLTPFTDLPTSSTVWYRNYARTGTRLALFRGNNGNFGGEQLLKYGQAVKVVVEAAIRANKLLPNLSGDPVVDVCSEYFPHIQTLHNKGILKQSFDSDANIDVATFCHYIYKAFNVGATQYDGYIDKKQAFRAVSYSREATYAEEATRISRLVNIYADEFNDKKIQCEKVWEFLDVSLENGRVTDATQLNGAANVTRGQMAKVISQIYTIASQIELKAFRKNGNDLAAATLSGTPTLAEMAIIGEKFDNAAIPVGNAPVVPRQVTYSCNAGQFLDIYYSSENDNAGNPLYFHWSMLKNGATLLSQNKNHSKVRFTAPANVSQPTLFYLNSYVANNKGMAYEEFITISVDPLGASGSSNTGTPTQNASSLNLYGETTTSIAATWTRGNGQFCLVTCTELSGNPSDQPEYRVYSGNSNFASAPSVFSSSDSKVVYTGTGNNVTVTGLLPNTSYRFVVYEYNVSAGGTVRYSFTGVSTQLGKTATYAALYINDSQLSANLSSNYVTLNYGAVGGVPPYNFTVYMADYNPTNSTPQYQGTNTSFSKTGLTYGQTYYYGVRVTDASGSQWLSNIKSFVVARETTAPTGSISIENGAANANLSSVILYLNATDNTGDVRYMRFSNDGESWCPWYPYNIIFPNWSLAEYGGTNTFGVKTVYAEFKDYSGNIVRVSDQITLSQGARGHFIVRGTRFNAIRPAIQYANVGDTVFVTPGFFDLTKERGRTTFTGVTDSYIFGAGIKSGITLMGAGADITTLYWNGNESILAGLTMKDNVTIQGLTLTMSDNPNYTKYAIYLSTCSNLVIKDCTFKGSYNPIYISQGGINTNITIQNCRFIGNTDALRLSNVIGLSVHNNVFYGNSKWAAYVTNCNNVSFKNNIATNNGQITSSGTMGFYSNTNLSFTSNCVWNNRVNYDNCGTCLLDQTGMNGNISQNPLYVNAASNDFRLSSGSPCINTGINVGLPSIGNPDMGVFESSAVSSLSLSANLPNIILKIVKPDGTTQNIIANTSPQVLDNLPIGIYTINAEDSTGYYTPLVKYINLQANQAISYNAIYKRDNMPPTGKIMINADDYATQSRYVTIFNDIEDAVIGLENGQMQFSNDGLVWSSTEPIGNKKRLWDLGGGSTSLSAGQKVVYAKFSDKFGNWSSSITDTIQYAPNSKIHIINNVRRTIVTQVAALKAGDIAYFKAGVYSMGYIMDIPTGVKLQGAGMNNVLLDSTGSIKFNGNASIANLRFGLFLNYTSIEEAANQSISNCMFEKTNFSGSTTQRRLRIRNSIFKTTTVGGWIMIQGSNEIDINNSVFDMSASRQETAIYSDIDQRYSDARTPNINNNIFINFAKPIYLSNAIRLNSIGYGDIDIKNNVYWQCETSVHYGSGTGSTGDFNYVIQPQFQPNTYLPTSTSNLRNVGYNKLIYKNHDGTPNTIGITGGAFYNTPPIANLTVTPASGNVATTFHFDASSSIDAQTPSQFLQTRWDFNNDGVFDTDFIAGTSVKHRFTKYAPDSIVCWVFDEHFAMHYIKIKNPLVYQPLGIKVSSLTKNTYCSGGNLKLPITIAGTFAATNNFNVQLSNISGSFATPTTLTTFTNVGNDSIICALPSTLTQGNNYRIRVVSNSPALVSDTTAALTVNAMPSLSVAISPNSGNQICVGTNAMFQAIHPNLGTAPQYQWKLNGANVGTATSTFSSTNLQNEDVLWVEVRSNIACASTTPTPSAPLSMQVVTVPTPFIQVIENTLISSSTTGNQWFFNDRAITGATNQFYVLTNNTQNGNYSVRVTQNTCAAMSQPLAFTYIAPSVSIQALPKINYCVGAALKIPYSLNGSFNTNTTYIVQLSNAAGSFAAPITVYSSATLPIDTIQFALPLTSPNGDGYRLRITTSNPTTVSEATLPFTITNLPIPTIQTLGNTLASNATSGNQWFFNGQAIANATSQVYTAKLTGFYTVQVTTNNCSVTSLIFKHVVTATNDVDDSLLFAKIYPNPTTGHFTVELENNTSIKSRVMVFNTLGQLILRQDISNNIGQFDISAMTAGIYLIKIQTAKGEIWNRVVLNR